GGAGRNDRFWVEAVPWLPHLLSYEDGGPLWIRRRCVPLTPEQSARLTRFALTQRGKPFALIRLGAQLTPFRSRGPLRTWVMGRPHGTERCAFFCSELVTEALVYAGLLDPETTRPAATYPRDLFFDQSLNLYLNRHLKLAPAWAPPARWTSNPVDGPPGAVVQPPH